MKYEIAPKETEIEANWDDAKLYCFVLNIDGKNDWRLPTKDELNEIRKLENDFEKDWYWSSTEYYSNRIWIHDFGGDPKLTELTSNKNDGVLHKVRVVRDL